MPKLWAPPSSADRAERGGDRLALDHRPRHANADAGVNDVTTSPFVRESVKTCVSSKLNAEWDFFRFLRDVERREADEFLASHAEDLGRRSTVEIEQLLSD
jgi:hypothetical protein